jgi:hypothetical protein
MITDLVSDLSEDSCGIILHNLILSKRIFKFAVEKSCERGRGIRVIRT